MTVQDLILSERREMKYDHKRKIPGFKEGLPYVGTGANPITNAHSNEDAELRSRVKKKVRGEISTT